MIIYPNQKIIFCIEHTSSVFKHGSFLYDDVKRTESHRNEKGLIDKNGTWLLFVTYSFELNALCGNIFQLCKEKCSLMLNATRTSTHCRSQRNVRLNTTLGVTQCKAFCGETLVWKSSNCSRLWHTLTKPLDTSNCSPLSQKEMVTMETASFTSLSSPHCSVSYSLATCTHKHTLYWYFFPSHKKWCKSWMCTCVCLTASQGLSAYLFVCSYENLIHNTLIMVVCCGTQGFSAGFSLVLTIFWFEKVFTCTSFILGGLFSLYFVNLQAMNF